MESTIYALVGGSNFRGGWTVYQSRQDADKFVSLLGKIVPNAKITTLFDRDYSRARILQEIDRFATILQENDILIMYFAGHGTQVGDRDCDEKDGMDEALQTDDFGIVLDDELTIPFVKAYQERDVGFKLVSITDTCHSPSFDMCRFMNTGIIAVSLKAALDNQSALQSGDGSYMSSFLMPILEKNHKLNIFDLYDALTAEMHNGYAGDMQACLVEVSHNELWNETLFN